MPPFKMGEDVPVKKTNVVTPELIRSLDLGSVIEAGAAMPGLCKEKYAFVLVEQKPEKDLYKFEVSAFGIFMFKVAAKLQSNGKILWEIEQ